MTETSENAMLIQPDFGNGPRGYGVPQEPAERRRLRAAARRYVLQKDLIPPLPLSEIKRHAAAVARITNSPDEYADFITVVVGNALWRATVASVPYERRVLLLPQCLRDIERCRGELDEFGLLCAQCGSCPIGSLQAEAEALGYVVLVAEGTTIVTTLLDQGKVDTVIGVSCLSVLERAFPHMAADAIPGIAIPLLRDGCIDTVVDVEWIREAIHLTSDGPWRGRLDIDALRADVASLFERDRLYALMGTGDSQTEQIALSWLAAGGKRWRPFLAACAWKALCNEAPGACAGDGMPESIQKIALSVECFHKASLIHDDIEDDDDYRYVFETLHREHGVPIALNVGDLLVGEGYRLISQCGADPLQVGEMLSVAARGHRDLCLGQGEELHWMRNPRPLSPDEVIEIFRHKTAPAFEVALRLAAIGAGAGAGEELHGVLTRFCESLGIAYQIRDDLEDFASDGRQNDGAQTDAKAPELSIVFAIACESATGPLRERVVSRWLGKSGGDEENLAGVMRELGVRERTRDLFAHYRDEAVRSLEPLRNVELKSLLHRAVTRILGRE